MNPLTLLTNLFKKKRPEPVADTRSVFKTQVDPLEIKYSAIEQGIIDDFEKLDRSCKRVIERGHPRSFAQLAILTQEHMTEGKHSHK